MSVGFVRFSFFSQLSRSVRVRDVGCRLWARDFHIINEVPCIYVGIIGVGGRGEKNDRKNESVSGFGRFLATIKTAKKNVGFGFGCKKNDPKADRKSIFVCRFATFTAHILHLVCTRPGRPGRLLVVVV